MHRIFSAGLTILQQTINAPGVTHGFEKLRRTNNYQKRSNFHKQLGYVHLIGNLASPDPGFGLSFQSSPGLPMLMMSPVSGIMDRPSRGSSASTGVKIDKAANQRSRFTNRCLTITSSLTGQLPDPLKRVSRGTADDAARAVLDECFLLHAIRHRRCVTSAFLLLMAFAGPRGQIGK